MDLHTVTQSLVTLAEDNMAFFSSQGPGETARRLSGVFAGVREQALGLEPTLGRLLSVAHLFDLDAETPANGYTNVFLHAFHMCFFFKRPLPLLGQEHIPLGFCQCLCVQCEVGIWFP